MSLAISAPLLSTLPTFLARGLPPKAAEDPSTGSTIVRIYPEGVFARSSNMNLSRIQEFAYFALCLEGLSFGLYSAIFVLYLQYQPSSKKGSKKTATGNILYYSLCALYVLTASVIMLDMLYFILRVVLQASPTRNIISFRISISSVTIFGICDFISQSILIYRCWIIWGGNIRVIIIPTILTFAFLATWLASNCSAFISLDPIFIIIPEWAYPILLSSHAMSMTVNALVTGLIVFRIFKVDSQSSLAMNLNDAVPLGSIIFILIESGMALFSIQLIRLVVYAMQTPTAYETYLLVVPIHEMLNGITPTLILVRVSMKLSFKDQESVVSLATKESLRFAAGRSDSHPYSETEGTSHPQETRDSGGDFILMVDR